MNPSRRRFLQQLTMLSGAVLFVPALARAEGTQDWVSVGPATAIKLNDFTRIVLPESAGKAVLFVTQKPDKTYLALSAVCTHKGCEVGWRKDDHQFLCPCHQGRFDAQGKNVGGPPRRPLSTWRTRVDDKGVLWVQPST